ICSSMRGGYLSPVRLKIQYRKYVTALYHQVYQINIMLAFSYTRSLLFRRLPSIHAARSDTLLTSMKTGAYWFGLCEFSDPGRVEKDDRSNRNLIMEQTK